jgi:hypothetical protein
MSNITVPFDFDDTCNRTDNPFEGISDHAPDEINQLIADAENDPRRHDRKPDSRNVESAIAQKELSDHSVKKWHFDKQDELLDEEARLVNFIHAKEFLRRLHNIPGFHAFYNDAGRPGELGLFAYMRGHERQPFSKELPLGVKYICFVQSPYMPEWSVIRLDEHNVPVNEKARGWRTVEMRLIAAGAITEAEGHEEFGEPFTTLVSRRFEEQLFNIRNYGTP